MTLSNSELFSLFKLYDSNCDGRVTYADFIRIILPKENLELRDICTIR